MTILPSSKTSHPTKPWQAVVLSLSAILVFFLLFEGGLALFGIEPASQTEDPFVGFAAEAPLFTLLPGPKGEQRFATAGNKVAYFNQQSFAREKAPNTYRIFSLGGSTTYGHPFDDRTSFSGWLRELLPVADRSKNWELINAGGISYASYRVARLMEELVWYQPDLFIIYIGHNEFLEERTYRKVRDLPPLLRSATAKLARTRIWSAMSRTLKGLGISHQTGDDNRFKLSVEVDALLDRSAGLDLYKRDDALRENILKHYRIGLENMVVLARSVGARIIFVTPAANLKDCSPFKSQHTAGITDVARQRSEELQITSDQFALKRKWQSALHVLDDAVVLDPRFADLHYRRGQALLALGRFEEAKQALILARDEDVCPLRALSPIARILAEVAQEQGVMLVDFIDLLERRMLSAGKYPILGEEYFLDHVHPTIEGHKLLAVALVETMADMGVVRPETDWGEKAIDTVAGKIKDRVTQAEQGRALANLARTLLWAGKKQEADRLARQALDVAGEYPDVLVNATSLLAAIYAGQGQQEQAAKLVYSALEKNPLAVELRLKLGQLLLDRKQREEAAANLLFVIQQMPYHDWGHALFGIAMADRGRPQIAYPSLMESLRLNPNNPAASQKLAQIRSSLEAQTLDPRPFTLQLDYYPSRAPRRLVQGRIDPNGNLIPDGIEAEFYENGRIKRFRDMNHGKPDGLEMIWDEKGKLRSRSVYRHGIPAEN